MRNPHKTDSSTKLSVKRSILENWRYLKTLRVIRLFSSRLVWLGFSGQKQVLGQIRWRVVKLSTKVQSYFKSTVFITISPTTGHYLKLTFSSIPYNFWYFLTACGARNWDLNRFMTTGINFSSYNRFIFNSLELCFPGNGSIFDTFWLRVLPSGCKNWEVMFSSKW